MAWYCLLKKSDCWPRLGTRRENISVGRSNCTPQTAGHLTLKRTVRGTKWPDTEIIYIFILKQWFSIKKLVIFWWMIYFKVRLSSCQLWHLSKCSKLWPFKNWIYITIVFLSYRIKMLSNQLVFIKVYT